ncbi:hypothetical protein HDV06_000373 [Boothiomyces sp. JEL0866]|nr:hypothetical protein HDV06_000373 [Boothiomyces sp. JEL0866]
MSLLLLANVIDATLMFQSAWISTECDSYPNLMVTFDDSNATPLYNFALPDYWGAICGGDPLLVTYPNACCMSSLDLTLSHGYTSMSFSEVGNLQYSDYYPASAANTRYCKLVSLDSSSLYGFVNTFYSADNSCVNNVTCSSTGQLSVYGDSACSNVLETHSLASQGTFSSSVLGNVTGSFVAIPSGPITYQWIEYTPEIMLVPNYKGWFEKFALGATILSFFLSLCMISYCLVLCFLKKNFKQILNLIGQIAWLIWQILIYINWVTIFPTVYQWNILEEFKYAFYNVASWITVIHTTSCLLDIYYVKTPIKRGCWFTLLAIIHILLAGSNYFGFWMHDPNIGEFLSRWENVSPMWTIFMFVFDILPLLAILTRFLLLIHSNKQIAMSEVVMNFFDENRSFVLMLSLQLIYLAAYIFISVLLNNSNYLGSDRDFLAIYGPNSLVNAGHAALNVVLMENLYTIIKGATAATEESSRVTSKVTSMKQTGILRYLPTQMD